MSYQVLARKWRPKTFRELVGQEHVMKALVNALDHNRLHHAYLFTGTRGVGKTTIARILAKCLNCEVGVSSVPCGQCSACTAIAEGRFVDLIEVDAASRTKVEDTRELLDNVQYAPTSGRFKVYLIDEVHMLSTHSFNALLKTLEEPPPHVKFLLATTDPQKLPATILSRCLQFNLKNMSPESIVNHLSTVLEQELVPFEEPALWLLGRAADGSMRDAMSLSDQAIAFGSGKLLEADVQNMLGTIDQTAIYDVIDALINGDGATLLAAIQQLSEHAPDYAAALEELLSLLHRVAVAQAVPDGIDNSFGDRDKIIAMASRVPAEDVQLFYQMALVGRRDLPLAADPRSGFEMTLLRMLAFKPAGVPELPTQGLTAPSSSSTHPPVTNDNVQEESSSVKKPEPAVAAIDMIAKPDEPTPQITPLSTERTLDATAPVTSIAPPSVDPLTTEVLSANNAVSQHQASPSNVTEATSSGEAVATVSERLDWLQLTPDSWGSIFDSLEFNGVVGSIASHCVLTSTNDKQLSFVLDERNATLFNDSHVLRIQEHLSDRFDTPLIVNIIVGQVTVETPFERRKRIAIERKNQALDNMQNDPNIQLLVNDFDAALDHDSVEFL